MAQQPSHHSFHLYREAKDAYHRLIPEKEDGLILLSLYERFGEGDFNEEQINAVIDRTLKDLGIDSSRNEYTRNSKIIIRLQDFFLWRDETNKTYHFKPYGLNFCERLQKRLKESYTPATIKRWFDSLYKELQELREVEGGFAHWIEDHFNLRSGTLAEQIEILDQQVSESVKEFKWQIKQEHPEGGIHRVLQGIEMQLDTIKQQARELQDAFHTTYDLDDVLTEMLEKQEVGDDLEELTRVSTFNSQVRVHLEQVSNRIDKIKPRVREFIYDFNQRVFDRKTGKFLDFLLQYSTAERNVSNVRVIRPPEGVPLYRVSLNTEPPKFVSVPLREIGPRKPVKSPVRTVDKERQQTFLQQAQVRQKENDRIRYWSDYAFRQIETEGQLDFSPLFFRILKEENGNLHIALRTAQRLLKRSMKNPQFTIDIQKEKQGDQAFPQHTLWKLHIHKP